MRHHLMFMAKDWRLYAVALGFGLSGGTLGAVMAKLEVWPDHPAFWVLVALWVVLVGKVSFRVGQESARRKLLRDLAELKKEYGL